MAASFYTRYPKRHQLTTFDAHLRYVEFRLSPLASDDWLVADAWCTTDYALRLTKPFRQPDQVCVDLRTPSEPPDPSDDPWNFYVSATPHMQLRGTLAVAEGLLGHGIARPPPLRYLQEYVTADPFLAELHQQWFFSDELLVSPPRPLHELLDPFAASLESYLTINSIYAQIDGLRPPRKRR